MPGHAENGCIAAGEDAHGAGGQCQRNCDDAGQRFACYSIHYETVLPEDSRQWLIPARVASIGRSLFQM